MIESKDNSRFRNWMKLKLKKYRDEQDLFLVYGPKLVNLAIDRGYAVEVLTSNPNVQGTLLSQKLMDELSLTETTFDLVAVCKKMSRKISTKNILVLEDIQNPDNVGALIRSAVAFGFNHVVLSLKSADLYNEKTIRASGGALFDCFVERLDIIDFIKEKKLENFQVFGADAHQTSKKPQNDQPLILVLGNEGRGLSDEVKNHVDGLIQIKTNDVESLNVVVAGSILMYEWKNVL